MANIEWAGKTDIREYLLDCSGGEEVWLLLPIPGEPIKIFPVAFHGFCGGQPAGARVVVSNPSEEGYSGSCQDDTSKFRRAPYLRVVELWRVYATYREACAFLIQGLLREGFSHEAIASRYDVPFKFHPTDMQDKFIMDMVNFLEKQEVLLTE